MTEPRTIEDVIKDPSLYLDRELFFDLIQDEGVTMTEIEASTHDPKLSKPKRKSKHIAFDQDVLGLRFFPRLYTLAAHFWDLIGAHRIDFPQLPKGGSNKSTYLHDIGKIIAMERKGYALTDLHGIGDDGEESVVDLIHNLEKPTFYVLKQSTCLITHLHNHYGPLPKNKKTTVDDKVRVMGLYAIISLTCWAEPEEDNEPTLMLLQQGRGQDFVAHIKISLTLKLWLQFHRCGYVVVQS